MKNIAPKIFSLAVYLLVLLMPLSAYREIGNPVQSAVFRIYVTPVIYITDLAALFIIFLGALLIFRQPQRPALTQLFQQNSKHIFLPLAGIAFLGALSIIVSISWPLALYTSIRWFLALGLYFVFQGKLVDADKVTRVFLIGLVVQTMVGLGQFIAHSPLGLPGEMALEIGQLGAELGLPSVNFMICAG